MSAPAYVPLGEISAKHAATAVEDVSDTEMPKQKHAASVLEQNEPPQKKGKVDVAETVPRCYQTVGSLPLAYWMHVLAACEPSSLSEAAQHALRPQKAGRHVPRQRILELVEMVTDFRPDDELTMSMHSLTTLVSVCKARNLARGRPCQGFVLPARWADAGVGCYSLLYEPVLNVIDRIYNRSADLPETLTSLVSDTKDLYISNNFSSFTAEVIDGGGHARLKVSLLFGAPVTLPAAPPLRRASSSRSTNSVPVDVEEPPREADEFCGQPSAQTEESVPPVGNA